MPANAPSEQSIQYLNADVALTAGLVQQFSTQAEPGVRYDVEALLYVNLSGAGIVTTSVGVAGSSPPIQASQLAEASAATALKSASGAGDQTIASGSIATGIHSIVLRAGLVATAAGTLFLSMSTGGAGSLLIGSTFRVTKSR